MRRSAADPGAEDGATGELLALRDTARAMSQENVEVVRAAVDAWNAEDVDAFADLIAPGVIMQAPEGWPEPGPFVGREAALRQFEQLRETWAFDALEVIGDFVDAGDRVAARVNWRGAGHGPEMCLEMTDVFTVREGTVSHVEVFWNHAEALEVLGLSE
jgi:ketosteroid isomerase-like protein